MSGPGRLGEVVFGPYQTLFHGEVGRLNAAEPQHQNQKQDQTDLIPEP